MSQIAVTKDPRDRFDYIKEIDRGASSTVYHAFDKQEQKNVAIKIINIEHQDPHTIHNEIQILSRNTCPQVTSYYFSFVVSSELWIIMEFLSCGSLFRLLRECKSIPEKFIPYILKQLLLALKYLHSEKQIHRDVKCSNLFVHHDGTVKLGDFGVTGQLIHTADKKNTIIGTSYWMAPEVITQSNYDLFADIWSLGITAIELALGKPPHMDSSIKPLQVIFIIPKSPPPTLEGDFSDSLKDFVRLCLNKDPQKRSTAAELLEHEFVRDAELTQEWVDFVNFYMKEESPKKAKEGEVSSGSVTNTNNGSSSTSTLGEDGSATTAAGSRVFFPPSPQTHSKGQTQSQSGGTTDYMQSPTHHRSKRLDLTVSVSDGASFTGGATYGQTKTFHGHSSYSGTALEDSDDTEWNFTTKFVKPPLEEEGQVSPLVVSTNKDQSQALEKVTPTSASQSETSLSGESTPSGSASGSRNRDRKGSDSGSASGSGFGSSVSVVSSVGGCMSVTDLNTDDPDDLHFLSDDEIAPRTSEVLEGEEIDPDLSLAGSELESPLGLGLGGASSVGTDMAWLVARNKELERENFLLRCTNKSYQSVLSGVLSGEEVASVLNRVSSLQNSSETELFQEGQVQNQTQMKAQTPAQEQIEDLNDLTQVEGLSKTLSLPHSVRCSSDSVSSTSVSGWAVSSPVVPVMLDQVLAQLKQFGEGNGQSMLFRSVLVPTLQELLLRTKAGHYSEVMTAEKLTCVLSSLLLTLSSLDGMHIGNFGGGAGSGARSGGGLRPGYVTPSSSPARGSESSSASKENAPNTAMIDLLSLLTAFTLKDAEV